jgi:hypothetical protein
MHARLIIVPIIGVDVYSPPLQYGMVWYVRGMVCAWYGMCVVWYVRGMV